MLVQGWQSQGSVNTSCQQLVVKHHPCVLSYCLRFVKVLDVATCGKISQNFSLHACIQYWKQSITGGNKGPGMRLFTNLVYPDVNWKSHELISAFEGCIYYPRPWYSYWKSTHAMSTKVICTACVKENVSWSIMCILNPTSVNRNPKSSWPSVHSLSCSNKSHSNTKVEYWWLALSLGIVVECPSLLLTGTTEGLHSWYCAKSDQPKIN